MIIIETTTYSVDPVELVKLVNKGSLITLMYEVDKLPDTEAYALYGECISLLTTAANHAPNADACYRYAIAARRLTYHVEQIFPIVGAWYDDVPSEPEDIENYDDEDAGNIRDFSPDDDARPDNADLWK